MARRRRRKRNPSGKTLAIGAGVVAVLAGGGVAAYFALRKSGTTSYRGYHIRWSESARVPPDACVGQASGWAAYVTAPAGKVPPFYVCMATKDAAITRAKSVIDTIEQVGGQGPPLGAGDSGGGGAPGFDLTPPGGFALGQDDGGGGAPPLPMLPPHGMGQDDGPGGGGAPYGLGQDDGGGGALAPPNAVLGMPIPPQPVHRVSFGPAWPTLLGGRGARIAPHGLRFPPRGLHF